MKRLHEALARLQRADPLELGTEHAWSAALLQERRYSRIFVLRAHPVAVGGDAQRLESPELVLKLYHTLQPERRQSEFDDLQRVQELCGAAAGAAVVQPVSVYADLGALVTRRAAGDPGAELVQRACRRGARTAQAQAAEVLCSRAGEWLRRFQEQQRGRVELDSPHLATPHDFVTYVDARLRRLHAAPFALGADLHQRALLALRSALQLQPPQANARVWSHSDFGPHNLLAAAAGITVLDFELMPQHAWFDAAYFVESLAGFAGPLYQAHRIQHLQAAFLQAYGVSGDEPLFLGLRLRHLVCTAASLRGQPTRFAITSWPQYWLLRRRLCALVQHLEHRTRHAAVPHAQLA